MKNEKDTGLNFRLYKILSMFIDGNGSVKSLERYWLINKKSIKFIKERDSSLYNQLVDDFKKQKREILNAKKNNNI